MYSQQCNLRVCLRNVKSSPQHFHLKSLTLSAIFLSASRPVLLPVRSTSIRVAGVYISQHLYHLVPFSFETTTTSLFPKKATVFRHVLPTWNLSHSLSFFYYYFFCYFLLSPVIFPSSFIWTCSYFFSCFNMKSLYPQTHLVSAESPISCMRESQARRNIHNLTSFLLQC
jgi:hypothetical protein